MDDSSQLRASDADRERLAEELRAHYAAGRLTAAELSDRLEAVYAGRTTGELAGLRADLPAILPPALPDPGRELGRRRLYQDAGGVVIASVACVAIWLAAGAHGQFWPIWVILVGMLRLARDGWRRFGPAADLEPEPPERRPGERHRQRRSW